MYRESEAQTNPYTPDFFVAPGAAPEVLLLKDLNLGDNQGGLGMKQVEMIENARRKRDVESNLPPFTDEAGLRLRKRLMEIQEMKEFRMREGEIDTRREARMEAIEQALRDSGGSVKGALETLGVSRRTLNEKMQRLGIQRAQDQNQDQNRDQNQPNESMSEATAKE